MSRRLHKSWLKVSAVTVGAGAPLVWLGTMPATAEPARFLLDLLSWPLDGDMTYASPDVRFLSALTAGFLMGWGLLIWRLSGAIYDAAPDAVRRAVIWSLLAWFLVDSAGSVVSGNVWNAAFNVGFLLLAVGPMWRPARDDT